MLILPAIDLRGGQCVRLRQGDYAQETVFGDDPGAMAQRWAAQGARFLHVVDLDGAKAGRPINGAAIRAIVANGVPCQLGGGLRTEADIDQVLAWGVRRVVVGTRALKEPAWLKAISSKHPGRVVLGIDAKAGLVATDGWLEVSTLPAVNFARACADWPLAAIVYTDIGKDGMMAGPNLGAMVELAAAVKLPVIASGGVSTLDDVRNLAAGGLAGCIIGRALYEGTIDLKEAIQIAECGLRIAD